ncbi:Ig lambda chain V region 4A [Podarcis lilfordi]|uniref:Ig lambda chain V region 4A n=1 Tax=Podarcis lilfordi TaxID=74358 RepID=A0AA35PR59_9SAUR|nr:Ig lambda chain V region 4A [Podarcis lilfordi]
MGPNLLLLFFSAFCNGLSSQAALTQTNGPVSVALRGSTTLSCTLQGVEFISTVHPSWYLQREGKAPQLLIYNSRERATGIPERFSGETYGNTAKLTVSSIEEGDEGDYYCAVWHENTLHRDAVICRTGTTTLWARKRGAGTRGVERT